MNKEEIKHELINRAKSLRKMPTRKDGIQGLVDHLTDVKTEVPDYAQKLTDVLNQIIREKGIDLDEQRKTELIEYLKPTMKELIGDFIIS